MRFIFFISATRVTISGWSVRETGNQFGVALSISTGDLVPYPTLVSRSQTLTCGERSGDLLYRELFRRPVQSGINQIAASLRYHDHAPPQYRALSINIARPLKW